jgi:hypothetical protein
LELTLENWNLLTPSILALFLLYYFPFENVVSVPLQGMLLSSNTDFLEGGREDRKFKG